MTCVCVGVADSQTFWQGILQVGLIDDFFREMKHGLDTLKHELIRSRGGAEGQSGSRSEG